MSLQAGVKGALAGVSERRMAEVMGKRQRFRQILIETKLARERAGNLRHLERVSEASAIVIAFVEYEHLGFVLEPAERGRVNDPVAVAPERAAGLAGRLLEQPPPAEFGVASVERARSSHSDRHGV